MDTGWKPFRFQLAMAARLILERQWELDPKKRRSQAYCAAIDAVMADPDEAQVVFEAVATMITQAINELSDLDAKLDSRTAKMRDMKDKLRSLIVGAPPLPADTSAGKAGSGGKPTRAPAGATLRPKKSSRK